MDGKCAAERPARWVGGRGALEINSGGRLGKQAGGEGVISITGRLHTTAARGQLRGPRRPLGEHQALQHEGGAARLQTDVPDFV